MLPLINADGCWIQQFRVEEACKQIKIRTFSAKLGPLWALQSLTSFGLVPQRLTLPVVTRSSSSLREFKPMASISICAITELAGILLSITWRLWYFDLLCFMRGIQVSLRVKIVKVKADNWYLRLVGQLTCQIFACKIYSREVASVDAPNGNAWYVGVRCKKIPDPISKY